MIKSLGNPNSTVACRLSWLLVEVDQGTKPEYLVIHSIEASGDINGAYFNRKVQFRRKERDLSGIIRLASDNVEVVRMELSRLEMSQKQLTAALKPLEANLSCLLRRINDDSRVQLITDSCKKLVPVENSDSKRRHFLLQKESSQVPVILLHVMDLENELLNQMEVLNNTIRQNCFSENSDKIVEAEGIENAYFLVQYFESRNNLVYTIIHYKDTIFKKENLFRNVVAYIKNHDQKTNSQAIILRKSFFKDELTQLLKNIRETCDNIDFRVLTTSIKR